MVVYKFLLLFELKKKNNNKSESECSSLVYAGLQFFHIKLLALKNLKPYQYRGIIKIFSFHISASFKKKIKNVPACYIHTCRSYKLFMFCCAPKCKSYTSLPSSSTTACKFNWRALCNPNNSFLVRAILPTSGLQLCN